MKYRQSTLAQLLPKNINVKYGQFPGRGDYQKIYPLFFRREQITVSTLAKNKVFIGCFPGQAARGAVCIVHAASPRAAVPPISTTICCMDKVTYNLYAATYPKVFLVRDVCQTINYTIPASGECTMPQICLALWQKRSVVINPGATYMNSALYDCWFQTHPLVSFIPGAVHFYYILLKRDPKRERNVYHQCAQLGSFTIFPAIDGKTHAIENNFRRWGVKVALDPPKKALLRNQYGCFFSHYNLWQKIKNTPSSTHSIILEDDVVIPPNYKVALDALINELPAAYQYCHLLMAGGKSHGAPLPDKKHITANQNFGNLAAYMLSPVGAGALINNFQVIRQQVDHQINRLQRQDVLHAYGPVKNLFTLNNKQLPSNIGRHGMRKRGKKIEAVKYNIYK